MAMATNPLRRNYALNHHSEQGLEYRDRGRSNEQVHKVDIDTCVISFSSEPAAEAADSWKGRWQWDLPTNITTWSEQLYWMVGRDRNEAVPCFKEHSCFYPSSSWEQLVEATLALLRTGEPYELSLQMLHTDGTRRSVVVIGEAVRDGRGEILQIRGTIEDISERKRHVASDEGRLLSKAQADLKACSRLIEARERENCNVATALRDNVCQRMSLLAASIQGLGLSFPGLPTEANMQFEELWRNTTEILYELDRISEQLHSSSLDLLGFTPAIQSLGRKIKSDSGVLVECRCANLDPGRLHDQFLPALFCIAEEALRNVAMHSRANIASLEVGQNSEEIVLRVSDDGVGFDRIKAEAGGGVGYIRIKESVRRIRGSLVVWSDPGHGTLVEVRAPAYDLHMAKV